MSLSVPCSRLAAISSNRYQRGENPKLMNGSDFPPKSSHCSFPFSPERVVPCTVSRIAALTKGKNKLNCGDPYFMWTWILPLLPIMMLSIFLLCVLNTNPLFMAGQEFVYMSLSSVPIYQISRPY